MTRIGWWFVDRVSRMLEPGERDAVLGDFAESGLTAAPALRDLLGLIIRRQAALWKDWRPWLALLLVVAPFGILLSLICRSLAEGSATTFYRFGLLRKVPVRLVAARLECSGEKIRLRHGVCSWDRSLANSVDDGKADECI